MDKKMRRRRVIGGLIMAAVLVIAGITPLTAGQVNAESYDGLYVAGVDITISNTEAR